MPDWAPVITVASALALAACGSASTSTTNPNPNRYGDFLSFSKCMRAQGVANFPDPRPGGGVQLSVGSGVNPRAPAVQSAQAHCKHLLPGGGPPSREVPASVQRKMLKQAECIRAHGVPNFPDPTFGKGGERGRPPGVDPGSPALKSALKACGGGLQIAAGP